MVRSDGHLWKWQPPAAPPAITFVAKDKLDLSGTWSDDKGNEAIITQTESEGVEVKPDGGPAYTVYYAVALEFKPLTHQPQTPVWWSTGYGAFARQGLPATPLPDVAPPVVYAGTQTVVNDKGQNQRLTFCVTGDLKTIVFGNGVKWTKQ